MLRSRLAVVTLAAGVLLVALFGGLTIYALGEIRARDAALVVSRAAEAQRSADVARLTIERDDLTKSREEARRERDDLSGQRDLLATARDTLTRRVADLERRDADQQRRAGELEARSTDLQARLTEGDRQLAAARQQLAESERSLQAARTTIANAAPVTAGVGAGPTAAQNPTPTPTSAPVPAAPAGKSPVEVARLIELDDAIKAEFDVLLTHIDAVSQAFVSGNLFAVNAAYQRGLQSADRLKDLFARRAPVLDRLR